MGFTKLTSFSKKPGDLPDVPSPSMTPDDIRSMWETPLDELLSTQSNLIDGLNANTGAANIGAKKQDGTNSTIQAEINTNAGNLTTHKNATTLDHPDKSVIESKLADNSVSRRTIQSGAVGTDEIDPSIWQQPTTQFGQQAKFDSIDAQLADIKQYNAMNVKIPFGTNLTPCIGDGTTDDSAALQAIINYCKTNNVDIAFPEGTYLITSPLVLNSLSNINISSFGKVIINFTGQGDIITLNGCFGVTFEGIQIQSNGANNGSGVVLSNTERTVFRKTTIFNVSNYCLDTTQSWWISSFDCVFDKSTTTSGGCVRHGANANNVMHFHSRFAGKSSLSLIQANGGYNVTINGCDISGDGTTIGIDANGVAGLNVVNNYFEDNLHGVRVGNTGYTVGFEIDGNYFNVQVGNATGINLVNCAYSKIGGNYFLGISSATAGILVGTNANNKYIDILSSNYFQGFTTNVSDVNNYSSYNKMRQIKFGWGQIPAGQTTAVISHNCGAVPNSVLISPQTNVGGNIWYTGTNATQFTANCATNSGSAVNFGWIAIL